MKYLLYILLSFSINYSIFAQNPIIFNDSVVFNKIVLDTTNGEEIMIGFCDIDALMNFSEFGSQYQLEFNEYQPNTDSLSSIQDNNSEIRIQIVLGTWCSDSQREFPRFIKILQLVGFPMENLQIIGVDRDKKADVVGLNELNINLVPTIIIYKDNIEIGRIIETPINSLESDLAKILTSNQP